MTFRVTVSGAAKRDLDQLNPRVTPAIVEFLFGPLAEAPHRVGKALRGDLEGLSSARRGEYRVLYRFNEADQSILVVRISHRSQAYRPR